MADSFTKLWSSILDSSIWRCDPETKVVWITMLAMAEQDGYVGASVGGLAARAGVSVAACKKALELFLKPDEDSRNRDHDGRRIEIAPRGWKILNYAAFRIQRDMLKKRAADAERQRRRRHAASVTRPECHAPSQRVAHADADADADAEMDGRMDGGRCSYQKQSGEGSGTPVPRSGQQTAGEVARGLYGPGDTATTAFMRMQP